MYLAGMAHAFDRGWLSIVQVLAFKPTEQGNVLRPNVAPVDPVGGARAALDPASDLTLARAAFIA